MNTRKTIGLALAAVLTATSLGCETMRRVAPMFSGSGGESRTTAQDLEPLVAEAMQNVEGQVPAQLPRRLKVAYICLLGDLPDRYENAERREFPMTQNQFSAFVFNHLDEKLWNTVREETVRDLVTSGAGLRYPADLWNPACQERLLTALDARARPFDYALVVELDGNPADDGRFLGHESSKWEVRVTAKFVRFDAVAAPAVSATSAVGKISWSRFDADELIDLSCLVAGF